ncbi:MAG TPA: bifunctional proline dehydrogenase/L-glutamate gamma-semialdehyde dehydrogenase PutA [Alphaproteobacteria bacterium]|nr:bifunctional proline dehydrogenase/L-glutamate gamma-semialdehyde dehydrogenase PutA [Alphaproteobacteria bacterium]
MIFDGPPLDRAPGRRRIRAALLADEAALVRRLAAAAALDNDVLREITATAGELVRAVRSRPAHGLGIETLLQEYQLDTAEGIALMCLAEALLRIPDADTANRLIRDKLGSADWERHVGSSSSLLVNAATWALALTGRLLREEDQAGLAAALRQVVMRQGEPVMRQAMMTAMRILGRQFVVGRTIDEALARAAEPDGGARYSFDMLGEAAHTAEDAARYTEAYRGAIDAIGRASHARGPVEGPGVSIKLSALHPRYEFAQRRRVMAELVPRVIALAEAARRWDIGLTVDAEEVDRLDLSLDVIAAVVGDARLGGWSGFGLAVQAYQKRALPVIDWLVELARAQKTRLMVRLVKGAYWDAEIKRAQERSLAGYPVFTRKSWTDLSYLAAARRLLAAQDCIYPQFATHNAYTLAALHHMADPRAAFEFQRLHGMGEALHAVAAETLTPRRPCRVYGPVGSHEELLPYLVRRLLENGANTSFVHKISDPATPIARLVEGPMEALARLGPTPHPKIPLPVHLFGPSRRNTSGIDMSDVEALTDLAAKMERAGAQAWTAAPVTAGATVPGCPVRAVRAPADRDRVIGEVQDATQEDAAAAVGEAATAQERWAKRDAEERAKLLERAADLFEDNRAALMARVVGEAGRTIPDALSEVREAVDFLRYYAAEARRLFAAPLSLPGPTGERNSLALHGRGVFVCISPWNFALSIFTGQIAAALAAGNAVIAKPAPQTPLIAAEAVRLMLAAGIAPGCLHLLPGGADLGGALVSDPRIAGVAFTGSTETGWRINRALAAREAPIATLIAETGGQNAMIVDSSALPEQVVTDALSSAFNSAGQRCSALRVLFVREEIADKVERMLAGAMAELKVGDPSLLATDVGPVIDERARTTLEAHIARLRATARPVHDGALPRDLPRGEFVAPVAFGLDTIEMLKREVFGPVMHVVRFAGDRLDAVVDAVNATGYGLTLGIHSRIDDTVERICARARVGNIYVNRNVIGAVVGVQPFGGERLSGTGPKAGGPHYLPRFAAERTLTVNTTAAGGNASLVSLED